MILARPSGLCQLSQGQLSSWNSESAIQLSLRLSSSSSSSSSSLSLSPLFHRNLLLRPFASLPCGRSRISSSGGRHSSVLDDVWQNLSIFDSADASQGQLEGPGDLIGPGMEQQKTAAWQQGRYFHFAALSAQTHRPPPHTSQKQTTSGWVTLGVLISLFVGTFWLINREEQKARERLGSVEEEGEREAPPSPPPPEMQERFERAKASVAQERMVDRAVAAIRTNDFVRCTVELELALEENRKARVSIEKDFYDGDELVELYRAALKVWLDGYPPDYGQLLQLRNLLHVNNQIAERMENEIQSQSDVFVI